MEASFHSAVRPCALLLTQQDCILWTGRIRFFSGPLNTITSNIFRENSKFRTRKWVFFSMAGKRSLNGWSFTPQDLA